MVTLSQMSSKNSRIHEVVKHRYALGKSKSLVDIEYLDQECRRNEEPFICIGCGKDMIARLPKKHRKHFYHKNSEGCSGETYLHRLAKNLFLHSYNQHLNTGKPFLLTRNEHFKCNHFERELGEPCHITQNRDTDLTACFDIAELEKETNGFRPDVLLSSRSSDEKLFIEFKVTHSSSDEKIDNGIGVVEISIQTELDATRAAESLQQDGRLKIQTYNLSDAANPQGDLCKGDCRNRVLVFEIHRRSRKCRLRELSPLQIRESTEHEENIHRETICISENDWYPLTTKEEFIENTRRAHFSGIPIKNCLICKNQGSSQNRGVICNKSGRFQKNSNFAAHCEPFEPIKDEDELLQIEQKSYELETERFQNRKEYFQSKKIRTSFLP